MLSTAPLCAQYVCERGTSWIYLSTRLQCAKLVYFVRAEHHCCPAPPADFVFFLVSSGLVGLLMNPARHGTASLVERPAQLYSRALSLKHAKRNKFPRATRVALFGPNISD